MKTNFNRATEYANRQGDIFCDVLCCPVSDRKDLSHACRLERGAIWSSRIGEAPLAGFEGILLGGRDIVAQPLQTENRRRMVTIGKRIGPACCSTHCGGIWNIRVSICRHTVRGPVGHTLDTPAFQRPGQTNILRRRPILNSRIH